MNNSGKTFDEKLNKSRLQRRPPRSRENVWGGGMSKNVTTIMAICDVCKKLGWADYHFCTGTTELTRGITEPNEHRRAGSTDAK